MEKKKREETVRFVKFVIVGMGNTLVTYVAYVVLRMLGVGLDWANFLSYVAGVVNSFVWNRCWVFRRSGGSVLRQSVFFLAGFAVCYGVQWLVFRGLLSTGVGEHVAQLLAMCVYTGTNYLYNRCVTFR